MAEDFAWKVRLRRDGAATGSYYKPMGGIERGSHGRLGADLRRALQFERFAN